MDVAQKGWVKLLGLQAQRTCSKDSRLTCNAVILSPIDYFVPMKSGLILIETETRELWVCHVLNNNYIRHTCPLPRQAEILNPVPCRVTSHWQAGNSLGHNRARSVRYPLHWQAGN